ncbi:hypothetical protein [Burkholderia sp. Ac-20379]|uniref:hypothetical protein n=1 Tax=Burkholderia sp. Ac-20379 TaxID=2703900 RepID=UPI00197D16FF|nr:hypothetical protein [Burkholderia sp. Ac-20379]MBN3725160.1 hypothetical protein [Burkholderia sp. Ac-20379]
MAARPAANDETASLLRNHAAGAASPAEEQAAELTVLALFATFERFVIERVQASNHLLARAHPPQYAMRLAGKFEREIEYWKFAEILDLFKGEVDPHRIGRIKQIKQYRDWIAHRNPARQQSHRISPESAFETLTEMIDGIRNAHAAP